MRKLKTIDQKKREMINKKTIDLTEPAKAAIKNMLVNSKFDKSFEHRLNKAVEMFKGYKRKN